MICSRLGTHDNLFYFHGNNKSYNFLQKNITFKCGRIKIWYSVYFIFQPTLLQSIDYSWIYIGWRLSLNWCFFMLIEFFRKRLKNRFCWISKILKITEIYWKYSLTKNKFKLCTILRFCSTMLIEVFLWFLYVRLDGIGIWFRIPIGWAHFSMLFNKLECLN